MKTPPDYKKYMRTKDEDKVHSLYSASGMDRILGCEGSTELIKVSPPQKDNKYSIRGTHTHTLIEFIFREGEAWLTDKSSKAFRDFIGFDEEMLTAAMVAVSYVRAQYKKLHKQYGIKPKLLIEQKLPLNDAVGEDTGGTSDIVLIVPGILLWIMDYKNGTSKVEAEENKQGLTYGLGALEKFGYDFKAVWITIIQPNAYDKRGPVRTWKTDTKKVGAFKKVIIEGIAKSKKKNAPRTPDPKYCFFCPAKLICPEQNQKALVKLNSRFEKPNQFVALSNPKDLEPLQIANLLNAREQITAWADALESYAEYFIERGGKIPGYGLIPKRASRVWNDEGKVRRELSKIKGLSFEDFLNESLKPLSEIEKLVGVDWVNARTSKVSSGMKLGKITPDDERHHKNGQKESNKKESRATQALKPRFTKDV